MTTFVTLRTFVML
jgi:hypothetical protein